MRAKSTKQQLLEVKYPADIEADVAGLRALGWSWRDIADTVSQRAGTIVTYESLRSWYGQPAAEEHAS